MPAKKDPVRCSIEGCERNAICKSYCDMHYCRFRKNGSPHDSGSRKVALGNEIERFHQKYKIDENGCWIWQAGTNANSKGVLYSKHWRDNGKTMSGHRFSYHVFVEPIKRGAYICHKCDTPLCVNPDHLFMSDHIGNMADMTAKGRSWKGSGEHANASILTNEQARAIRFANGSQSNIAKDFGVSQACVSRIKRNVTYRDA